jgi:hypothetical protein
VRDKKQILMMAIIALGVFLRLFKLSSQGVWIDEYITASLASGPNLLYVFFDSLANNPHPPLFFMLEHIMVKIFGVSALSIRILPAIIGIVNIFIFYKLTRSFFSEKVSMIALFLFALNPYQIYYSQEARMYSLFLMTSMLIIYYFLMSIKYNTFAEGPFISWSVIGLYVHNYTILLLLVLNFIIFVTNRKDLRPGLWLKAQLVIFICWLPMLLFFLKGVAGEGYSHNGGLLLAPVYSLKNFLFGLSLDFSPLTAVLLAVFLVFSVLGIVSRRKANEKKVLDITAIIIILVMGIPWLESFIKTPVYSDRTLIMAGALVLITIAMGISYMSDQGLAVFLAATLAIYSVSLFNYYFVQKYQKIPYEAQYLKVVKGFKEGDAVLHTSVNSYASFEFYNKFEYKRNFEDRLRAEIPEFKENGVKMKIREMWRGFKEALKNTLGMDIYAGYEKNILPSAELEGFLAKNRRIWLVMDNETGIRQVWLPLGNVWNSKEDFGKPPEIDKIWWTKDYGIKEKFGIYGNTMYLLEKK